MPCPQKLQNVVIWLDDLRNPSQYFNNDFISSHVKNADVHWVKNFFEFRDIIHSFYDSGVNIHAIFFDHDLGDNHQETGADAFNFLDEFVREHNLLPIELYTQSTNPSGVRYLEGEFESLYRFWQNLK